MALFHFLTEADWLCITSLHTAHVHAHRLQVDLYMYAIDLTVD